ncbi:MAG: hypothetical protein IJ857_09285 [Lachnospiraceae bacterium]|nr:hypothetical protein [Lachnospiraceae bacterium]
MERRRRSLLAFLLTIVMVVAESTTAIAAYPAGVVEEKEPEILGETGYGFVGIYKVEGDLVYPDDFDWTVTDYEGRNVTDCEIKVSDNSSAIKYNGKGYSSIVDASIAGLKPGDTIDVDIVLSVKKDRESLISPTESDAYDRYEGTVHGVRIEKGQITKKTIRGYYNCYLTEAFFNDVKDRSIPWGVNDMVYSSNYNGCVPYLILTDKGAEKLKDPKPGEEQILNAYEDFNLRMYTMNMSGKRRVVDVTDWFDIDLAGVTAELFFISYTSLGMDVNEIRMGASAGEFRKILKDHAYLMSDGKRDGSWSSDDMVIEGVYYRTASGNNDVKIDYNDDSAVEAALAAEGNTIRVEAVPSEYADWDDHTSLTGCWEFTVRKNSYRLVIEPFREVASATGASYDRTKHDFMSNVYAVKNETEKIPVGSLGDGERFRVNIIKNNRTLRGAEKEQFFENIRPGDRLDYSLKWYIPSDGRSLEYRSFVLSYSYLCYIKHSLNPLEFFEYGSGDEQSDTVPATVSSPYVDPFAPAHKTEAYDIGELPADAAPYEFDVMRSTTAIGAVPVKISKKFSSYVSMDGFDPFVNHRFTTDNRSIATVDKKGYLKPKKRGRINIFLEQKSDDGGWIRLGEPVEMFVQVPQMKKKEYASVGAELCGHSFISMTTFAPNKWISSKPSVAMVDEKTGKITVVGTGTTKIIAVYGNPENRKYNSKKKYKTTLKVE